LVACQVVAYFAKATRHYGDKDMLVIPFNMGNPINFYHVQPGLVLLLLEPDRSNNW
jgi:hypothetical protein